MTPEADTVGLTPSACAVWAEPAIMEKASSAAAQAWVKQLDIGISGLWFQRDGASAGADAARSRVRRRERAPPRTSEKPMPATQAVQPRRSNTWPSTTLPARPPRK